jgi:Tetratricopeptide repeat
LLTFGAKCVALNESWAKGHVRLASAYIALGDHSNDACNALQRALSLDPGNTTARQMLMRELRRDRVAPTPSAPPEEELDEPVIDDAISWSDRLKSCYMQAVVWYHGQSDDVKNLIKVGLIFLGLYVAFGGRFGLGQLFSGNAHPNRGNYERGNAYDRYYGRGGNSYSSSQRSYEPEYEYRPRQERSQSYHFPNLFDGSPASMICLAVVGYLCHRHGINPFHAIFMLNIMNGNRGGRRGMHWMPMYGMGGMGYGMMQNRFGNQQRGFQRNGWR